VSALPDEDVRVALIGLGRMGIVHAQALAEISTIEVAAVADERPEAIERAAHLLGDARRYASAHEALIDPAIEACIIVTPTDSHYELARAALRRSLHVFCEKPLTLDQAQAAELSALGNEAGTVLQVGFWRRYFGGLQQAKELLAAGAIGQPVFVRAAQWDRAAPLPEWCSPSRSGGIFVDMGVHEFDQLEWLLGDQVSEVEGKPFPIADPAIGAAGDYDNAGVLLRFATGTVGFIDLSRNGRYADDVRLEALGTDGAIFVETHPVARVRLGDADGLRTVWEDETNDPFAAAIVSELEAFARAVRRVGADHYPGAAQSIRAVALATAARHSSETGKVHYAPEILAAARDV
jgi:predicted dehydrogenase